MHRARVGAARERKGRVARIYLYLIVNKVNMVKLLVFMGVPFTNRRFALVNLVNGMG
jgi:hypothetical protein